MGALWITLLLAFWSPFQDPGRENADDQYHFVVGLFEKGLYDLAAKESRAFLQKWPDHPNADLARYRLAASLFELGKTDEAAPEFRKLTTLPRFEFAAESSLRLAQCELAGGNPAQAVRPLEHVLELDKDYLKGPATFLLGEASFRGGDFEKAETFYRKALEMEGGQEFAREASYGLAWCSYRLKKYDEAVSRIQAFLKKFPGDAFEKEMDFLMGESYSSAGKYAEALKAYAAVDQGPFADAALRGTGFARVQLGDPKGAAEAFGELLKRFPASRFAYEAALHRGVQLLRAGDPKAARKAFDHPAAGDGAEISYWRARAADKAGDPKAALGHLGKALGAKPDKELLTRIQTELGDVFYETGDLDKAVAAYRKAGTDYAFQAAAVASLNEGHSEQAVQLASEFLKKFPKSSYHARVLLTLGEGRLALKQYDPAEKTFSFVAEDPKEDPGLRVRAVSRIGWCRFLKGDSAGAAEVFQGLSMDHPDAEEAEEAGYMAGRAWVKAGQPDAAKAAWLAYLQAHPEGRHSDAVLLGLAGLLDGDARVARLKELLEKHPQSGLVIQALFDLGEQLSADGNPEEAALQYQQVIQRAPKSELALRAHYSLAWILYQKEQYDPAVAHLAMVANHPKTPPDLRMATWELLVWAERKRGNPDGAVDAYREYAQGDASPEQRVEAAKIAAVALKDAGRIEEADALLDEAAAGTGGGALTADLQVERVYLALDQDHVDRAEELARTALAIAPKSPAAAEALFFVGEALFDLGENEKAAAIYELAAGVPESKVADRSWYKRGFALLRAGKKVEAAGAFGQVVDHFPKSELYGECLFLRGEAFFQAGRFEEAVVDLARLRTELPKHELIPKDLFRLGIALCRLERWEEADEVLSDLSKRFPDFENGVEGELWRGRALAALGRPRGARQAFDAVLEKDNGVLAARAHLEVGKLDFEAGNLDEALSEFLKVAVLYSNEAEVSEALYRAGGCLEKMGDSERAVAQYQEVLQKYPKTEYAAPSRERLKQLGAL